MNVTIHDVEQAKKHEEIENAYALTNTKYKTSLVYGAKIILVSRLPYMQLKIFVKLIRPVLIHDKTKLQSCDSYLHLQWYRKTESFWDKEKNHLWHNVYQEHLKKQMFLQKQKIDINVFYHNLESDFLVWQTLHEKKNFLLMKVCEKCIKGHTFVGFCIFPFLGNIMFSDVSIKRKC